MVTIDGYKYILNDGSWLMIRPSGTEAVVRVYSESFSSERLKPVSYTHLDVYKRQRFFLWPEAVPLQLMN